MNARPRSSGSRSEPARSATSSALPELLRSGKNPWRIPRFCVSGGPYRDPLGVKVDRTGQIELCAFTRQLHPLDTNDSLLDGEPNRTVIADSVIEQAEIELLDYAVNPQAIEVSELTPHADRATGDCGRHG